MADGDPLETVVVTPATPAQPRDIVCGACGCKIARSGEILRTGETYKAFLKHEQTIEQKDREIASLTSEVNALKSEVSALKAAQSSGTGASHRPGSRVA
jgi:hypothetical protein